MCKVRYIEDGITAESDTLDFVRAQRQSFEIPEVILHFHDHGRSYLFLQKVPGRTLDAAWPTLDDHWRRHYVDMVTNICEEMARWK